MRTTIIYIAYFFLLTSCVVTQKQRDKFCDNCPQITIVKDSIITKTEYRDTIIYISTDPVTHTIENPCDSLGRLKDFTSSQTKNGITTIIKGRNNKLIVTCEADSLRQIIKALNERITKQHFKSETKLIEKQCELKHKRSFDSFTNWWFFITVGIITLFILLKVFLQKFFNNLPDSW